MAFCVVSVSCVPSHTCVSCPLNEYLSSCRACPSHFFLYMHAGSKPEDTVIIGDNISTDILSGIEAGVETALVLSGVTARGDLERYAYRPHHILDSIADLVK